MAIRERDGLGTLVKRYRGALGLTQEELAERAGVSARSISDLERGRERTPYPGTIRRLADALELTPAQRAAFMTAGSRPRDEDDVPAVRKLHLGRIAAAGRSRWRLVAAALLVAALTATAATVLTARGSGTSSDQTRVYSTARSPVLLDVWGAGPKTTAAFGPNVVDVAAGPPGYEYAISFAQHQGSYDGGFMALRFSTTGQALGAWPVSEQAAGLVSAAVDAQGDLWITTNVDVREFSPDGRRLGLWSTQGFNPGQLANPLGIVIARNGDVIVGDGSGHRVQVFSRRMTPIRQWNVPGIGVQSFEPALIAVDSQDDVYVLDTGSWQIDKYTLGGTLLGTWRSGLPKPAPGSSWNADLSVDGDGNVYAMVSVGSTLAIEKLSPSGRELRRWTSVGRHGAVSSGVDGLRFAGTVGYLSLADGRVLKVDERMHVLADWTLQRLQRPLLRSPLGIAAGSAGRVYVADDAAHEVIGLSFRTGGVTRWKAAMAAPAGPFVPSIAVDPSGDVVVADADGSRIDTYLPDGKLLRRSGTSAGPSNPIRGYTGLGIDAKGYLSALTYPQSTLRTFSPSGRLNHQWCAVCDFPNFGGYATMMTVDPAGNVYIALTTMVLELSPSSGTPIHSWNAHEIAGYGTTIDVAGIAVDRQGDLYVSDLDNNALEVFSPSGNLLASWKGFGSNAAGASDLGPVTVDPQGDIFVIVGKSV